MMGRRIFAATACLVFLCVLGCATPVGVKPADEKNVYRQLTRSALSSDRPSAYSGQLLARLGLGDQFKKDPAGTLAELHKGLGGPGDQDRLFALAELSYVHAKHTGDARYFLAAAVYAYLFLFPEDRSNDPLQYDPRLRLAMDLYNRGVLNGLQTNAVGELDLSSRRLDLPFGRLDVTTDRAQLTYDGYRLAHFVSVEDFKIRGLRNHYRRPGIGAPVSARIEPMPGKAADEWIPPGAKVPLTAFMRLQQPGRAIRDGRLTASLEIVDVDVSPTLVVDGRSVPMESDPSATLAYSLDGSPIWDFEIAGFRRGDFMLFGRKQTAGALYFLSPYRPGRIPVVFVHGTASSPARWAEMINELVSDPAIAARYQFWYYIYNSGNPIPLSSMYLREDLQRAVSQFDPAGRDPALRDMVVIGHSQGGLLAKMTAVSSGNRFWDTVSRDPFEKVKLTAYTKDILKRSLFVEPLPFVKRLIFISTPHQGAYMAENIIGKIGRRFITLPATMTKVGMELITLHPASAAGTAISIPTAVDNMSWSSPFLRTLYALPVAPGVRANSIIAVKGSGPVEDGDDGVVMYRDAHIKGVESELVVRSGHSCQSNPSTIEEVRRILYEHAGLR
ncbi:MAG: alpha/beta fold hydrolase [Candidatus Sumerlaeia bacterium]